MNEISCARVSITDADHVRQWLSRFSRALTNMDRRQLEDLFCEDSHWRDLLAFTWNITPHDDRSTLIDSLLRHQPDAGISTVSLAESRTPPRRVKRQGIDSIEAVIEFETSHGRGHGIVRLLAAEPGKAWLLT